MRRKTYERNRGFAPGYQTKPLRKKPMRMKINIDSKETLSVSRSGELTVGKHKVGFVFHTYYEDGKITCDDLEWTYGELNKLGKSDYYKACERVNKLCREIEKIKWSDYAKQRNSK